MLSDAMIEKPDWVSSPGQTIISILEERELTIEQFAHQIDRSAAAAQKILDGSHAIDVDLARQLARILGASENFWMAREHDYRASVAPPPYARIASLPELFDRLPVSDMQKFGWVDKARSKDDQISECLSFFGVSSLAQWQDAMKMPFNKRPIDDQRPMHSARSQRRHGCVRVKLKHNTMTSLIGHRECWKAKFRIFGA